MSRVMHRGGGVVAGADEAELVGNLGVQRQDFRNLEGIALGADGFERAANLARSIGLHVPEILLARGAEIKDHDAGLVALFRVHFACGLQFGEAGHRQPDGAEGACLQEITTRNAVAIGDGALTGELEHGARGG